jgi:alpha-glucosidase
MEVVAEMRSVVAEFDDATSSRILIGEIYLPIQRLVAYYGADEAGTLRGVQLPFNFHLISAHWEAAALADLIRRYEAALPQQGWPNWVLGNHDQPRIASRIGAAHAALAACLLLTLRGTPTLYYGEEIGMSDVAIAPEALQDPAELREPGKGQGRDPQRTPMQWDGSAGAGFSRAKPWLPLAPDCRERNVERLLRDGRSILSLYRELLALRRREPALHAGAIESVAASGDCLCFDRVHGSSRLRVQINFGSTAAELPAGMPAELSAGKGAHPLVFSSAWFGEPASDGVGADGATGLLPPLVARIVRVDPPAT